MSRSFGQLSKSEMEDAIFRAKQLLIAHLYEGVIEIDLRDEIAQRQHEIHLRYARQKNSSKLLEELVNTNPQIKREVDKISIAAAQGSWYDGSGFAIM